MGSQFSEGLPLNPRGYQFFRGDTTKSEGIWDLALINYIPANDDHVILNTANEKAHDLLGLDGEGMHVAHLHHLRRYPHLFHHSRSLFLNLILAMFWKVVYISFKNVIWILVLQLVKWIITLFWKGLESV